MPKTWNGLRPYQLYQLKDCAMPKTWNVSFTADTCEQIPGALVFKAANGSVVATVKNWITVNGGDERKMSPTSSNIGHG